MPNASTRANPPSDVFIAVWEVKSNVPRMGAAGIPSVAVVVAVFAYAQAVGCETSRPLPCLSSSCRGRESNSTHGQSACLASLHAASSLTEG